MFNLLKKKLYMILAMVFCILSVVLTFNYVIIEKTIRNDYIKKAEDIARKHIEDFAECEKAESTEESEDDEEIEM